MQKDVQKFRDSVTDERRQLFDKLHSIIIGMYPDAVDVINYGIPMFKAKSGWVGLGYWKGGATIYTKYPDLIAEFKEKYPDIKTGKGCINFKTLDKIRITAVKKIIKHAMETTK